MGTVSEDAVRLGMRRMEEKAGLCFVASFYKGIFTLPVTRSAGYVFPLRNIDGSWLYRHLRRHFQPDIQF